MSYPSIYDITYSYTGFQQAQGDNSFPGTQLDADLAGLQDSIENVATFTEAVVRSDGALQNGIVTYESLAPSLQTSGLAPADPWATGVLYNVGKSVIQNGNLYRSLVSHASGVFATDLAAGKWLFITPAIVSGGLIAADNLADLPDKAAARANLGVAASTAVLIKMSNLLDVEDPDVARENLKGLAHAATRAALSALDTTKVQSVLLLEAGREGPFVWRTGDHMALINADPQQGCYIKADALAATTGAWERVRTLGVYNVKHFGAKGDFPTTNDCASIQSAINLANACAGGDILFPQGGYRIDAGLTRTNPLVRLVGVGKRYCSIQSSQNIDLITISAARCGVENLSIFNQIVPATSKALINIASGAVQCTIRDLDMVGGSYCFRGNTGSTDVLISDCVMRQAMAGASAYIQDAGAYVFDRCLFNQDWPVGVPAPANDKGARANSTAYAIKDYVTVSGVLLQCKAAGTSGISPPSFGGIWYGTDIVDGGVTWRIAGNSGGAAAQVDSGSTFITFRDCDFTGSYLYGAVVSNGLGTAAPDVVRFFDCTTGGMTIHGFHILACKGLWIEGCDIQANVGSNPFRSGVAITNGVTGGSYVRGNRITAGFAYGVLDQHVGGMTRITDNDIFGMATAGISVQAGVTDFLIEGNNVGASSIFGNNPIGIEVVAGASDYYAIVNNRARGLATPISDGGTGVRKTTSPNII